MERQDFLKLESPIKPEEELKLRAFFEKYAAVTVELSELKDENAELKQRLAWFEKQVYGRKTEKTEVVLEDGEQLRIFDEAETEADKKPAETVTVAEHKRKAKRTHDEIAAELPVEEVLHEVEDKTCGRCGAQMETVGREKIHDELVYVPARWFLRRHFAQVVKCTKWANDESRDRDLPDIESATFRKAVVPAPLIPHSFCSPEMLAHILYEKYCEAVPLYRQEQDLASKGVKLARTTMANWVIHAAESRFEPIWNGCARSFWRAASSMRTRPWYRC